MIHLNSPNLAATPNLAVKERVNARSAGLLPQNMIRRVLYICILCFLTIQWDAERALAVAFISPEEERW